MFRVKRTYKGGFLKLGTESVTGKQALPLQKIAKPSEHEKPLINAEQRGASITAGGGCPLDGPSKGGEGSAKDGVGVRGENGQRAPHISRLAREQITVVCSD